MTNEEPLFRCPTCPNPVATRDVKLFRKTGGTLFVKAFCRHCYTNVLHAPSLFELAELQARGVIEEPERRRWWQRLLRRQSNTTAAANHDRLSGEKERILKEFVTELSGLSRLCATLEREEKNRNS